MTLVVEPATGACDAAAIEVALLGPVEAKGCDGTIGLGGPKDRAVLAQLALAGGRLVSEASLIDGIWGEEPPERSGKLVQNQVLRLRKAMRSTTPEPVILTGPRGYRLAMQACSVDV